MRGAFHGWKVKRVCKLFQKTEGEYYQVHVIKGTVNVRKLNDGQDKFCNNSIKSMNKLLKNWQSYKKIDLYAFAKESEQLVQCQKSNVLKAYLGLRGPYEVREEFKNNMRNFNAEYASLSAPEKAKVKELLLNVAVEPKAYTSIMKIKESDEALGNRRRITKNSVMKHFQQESEEVGDQIVY